MQLGITELDTEMFHRVLDTRLFRGQKVGFTKHKNIAGMGHDALVKSVATGWSGVDMSTPPPFSRGCTQLCRRFPEIDADPLSLF